MKGIWQPVFQSLKNLFKPKRLGHPKDEDVFVFAELHINPDSEIQVILKYGDILPDNSIARALVFLVLYQAANIRVNLETEPASIQSAYHKMMVDIINHWPEGGTEQAGDFYKSLPFFKEIVEDDDFIGTVWAANGGETIELKLARMSDDSLWLYEYYPGMPGYGPLGLAINLAFHYLLLIDFVLALLDGPTCEHLGQSLSELWLTHLQLPFGAPHQMSKPSLYEIVGTMLEKF